MMQVNQELQKVRSQQTAMNVIPPEINTTETQQLNRKINDNKEAELEKKIQDLELQNANLEEDLKMTIIRQREAGASANEVLRQLESEISTYSCFLNI